MVSGRHKAHERADSPENDVIAHSLKQTNAAHSLELTIIKDAKVNTRTITVNDQKFSRRAINKLVTVARNMDRDVQSLPDYAGAEAEPVEWQGKRYIGLMTQADGKHFILYDFLDKQVKKARIKQGRITVVPDDVDTENPDFGSEDLLAKLEREYKAR